MKFAGKEFNYNLFSKICQQLIFRTFMKNYSSRYLIYLLEKLLVCSAQVKGVVRTLSNTLLVPIAPAQNDVIFRDIALKGPA